MTAVITPENSKVIVARGPRAAETELLRLVGDHAPRSLEALGQPLRIVVPSASLRLHVLARLVADARRPLVGVVVQTLSAAAQEVVEGVGERVRPAGELMSILVRRLASTDPVLGSTLAGLDDGYGIVEAAVRDLLDSGFQPEHAAAVADKLRDLDGILTPDRLLRVAGVVKVAAEVAGKLGDLGVLRVEQQPQRAAELLRVHGPAVLPSSAVIIHGFADATGVATDFIQTMMAVIGGAVVIDRPPDPVSADRDDAGGVFLDRFSSHLGAMAMIRAEQEPAPPTIELFCASTADIEARQVAHRVRALLDTGVRPEGIGIVARELEGEAVAARRHLMRLGVPFSGSPRGLLAGGEVWRGARRLAELLRQGTELPAELWLEALDFDGTRSDLGLALRTLGVVSLADAAGLCATMNPRSSVTLPFPDAEEGEARRGRTLEGSEVLRLAARAEDVVATLTGWPNSAAAAEHMVHLQRVLESLGWLREVAPAEPVVAALDGLVAELPVEMELEKREFVEAVRRRLAEVGLEAVGGAGGGVQLLSAMEARGRTFEHLFLIALNRGRFPRIVEEDALLPDTVRGHLAAEVLPEFPVKARGLDEERYLFAQLAASSDHLTLSWRATEDGSRVAPSPFVERLRRELGLEPGPCPTILDATGDLSPRPVFEHAILAADGYSRESLMAVLAETLVESGERAGIEVTEAMDWSAARTDVLQAVDPPEPSNQPGPWAGLVGDVVMRPESSMPAVTGLEDVARCPWRAFVGRRLGISEMPDPRLGLPDTRGLVLGSVVHEVLQKVVDEAADRDGDVLTDLSGVRSRGVPWPDSRRLDEMVAAAAHTVAVRNGLAATGVTPLLAAQAHPFLEVARTLDWSDGVAPGVLAAEVSGETKVDGAITVRFRADRVDRHGDDMVLVDYKSGKPLSNAVKPDTRRRHLLAEVARGRVLQAVAYALATTPAQGAEGRYLALRPDIGDAPEEARSTVVRSDDDEIAVAFGHAVNTIVTGWRVGGLTPRVEEAHNPGKVPPACNWCPVAQACLRSDTGYRQRVVQWMQREVQGESEAERAAHDLWWLGVEQPDRSGQ